MEIFYDILVIVGLVISSLAGLMLLRLAFYAITGR